MTSSISQKNTFLDLFIYECKGTDKGQDFYINCTFLKDFGKIRKGDYYTKLYLNLGITGFKDEECTADENENI